MARVHVPFDLRHLAEGRAELEVPGDDYRGLMAALGRRFPTLGQALQDDKAFVLDGEIIDAPLLEAVGPHSEVHFLPRIGGG